MGTRAEALAQRIEQGAATLAAYAQGLSDTQWTAVVPPDGRRAGVIIHHVASVYPIEVHLANEIAAGRPVTDVTWAAVAEMNAKHAQDNAGCSKEETIELLKTNGQAAAQAVRGLSDAQLDTAAAFSLGAGAPLTAQFVIEDHALRHSWHHLAKIKAALG
jgi:hypothetical protein